MPVSIRPKNDPTAKFYAPDRDLAYIYQPAMREALYALDAANWTDEMRGLVERLGISERDIAEAVRAITQAHRLITTQPDVTEPDKALELAGYYEQPLAARFLVFARLGEVLFGGFFLALRDVTWQADEPSQPAQQAEMLAAGELIARRLAREPEQPSTEQELRRRIAELQERVQQQRAALDEAQRLLHAGPAADVSPA